MSHKEHHHDTLEADKTPVKEKVAFSLATLAFSYGYSGIQSLALPIYNITLGISPGLIGLVLGLCRLWDAVTDPIMGTISDNTRSRWGRRRPYVLVGAILCGITFPIIWFIPVNLSQGWIITYFAVTSILFYTAFTVYSVPYLSLGYELTTDYHERTRVWAWRAVVGKIGMILIPFTYSFAQSDFFEDTIVGIRTLGILVGIGFILVCIPAAFICRERYQKIAKKQKKIKVKVALKEALKNRPFLILLVVIVSTFCGMMMIGSMGYYIVIYHVFDGNTKLGAEWQGYSGIVYSVFGILAVPVTTRLSSIFGRNRVMGWVLVLGFVASVGKYFLYDPRAPWLMLIVPVLLSPSIAGFWMLVNPMKADVADYDELQSGLRREGLYTSVSNWIEKLGVTLIVSLSGFVIEWSGFDKDLGGDQPEGTILSLRLMFAGVPAVCYVISWVALQYYPLNEDRMYEIRDELEARRGEIH